MEKIKVRRRTTLYQACAVYTSEAAMRDHLISLNPFCFEKEEEAFDFAIERGTPRELIEMTYMKVIILDNYKIVSSLDKTDEIEGDPILSHHPEDSREVRFAQWDAQTIIPRKILLSVLNDPGITRQEQALREIVKRLQEMQLYKPLWRVLDTPPDPILLDKEMEDHPYSSRSVEKYKDRIGGTWLHLKFRNYQRFASLDDDKIVVATIPS